MHTTLNNFISVSDVVTCEIKNLNNLKLFQCFISDVTSCGGYMWNKNTEIISELFQIILFYM